MKHAGWLVASLLLGFAVLTVRDSGASQKDLEATRRQNRILQAQVAELSIAVEKRDTVWRVAKQRVDSIRDTLNIHDTIQVLVYVERTDAALHACTDLANACTVYRSHADSLIEGLTRENAAVRQYAEREARRLQAQKRLTLVALIGGTLAGAWLRGP